MKNLIIKNFQSPGDIVMLSYAIKALHQTYPGEYKTDVRTSCQEIFYNNPFITKLNEGIEIELNYPTIHLSNDYPVQFINSFVSELSSILKVPIYPPQFYSSIFLNSKEIKKQSVWAEAIKMDVPYWVISPGCKKDYTCKAWEFNRYQQLIDKNPNVFFVQIGASGDNFINPDLRGENLINLVGKTSIRDLIHVIYNSFGVISGISLAMHLAYAIPPNFRFKRKNRACIVIGGGRESPTWEHGPNMQFIHTTGMLECCQNGGCWKSRIEKLNDNSDNDKSICSLPVVSNSNQIIPKCMDMISVDEVSLLMNKYISNYSNNFEVKDIKSDKCILENNICKKHKFIHNQKAIEISQSDSLLSNNIRMFWDSITPKTSTGKCLPCMKKKGKLS